MTDRFPTPQRVIDEMGVVVPEQQAYLNLIRAAEVLSVGLSELMSAHGLTGKQYNVLRAIRRAGEGGLPVSRIGEQMTDPKADVTRFMDRLERDGFVERVHDKADRRVVRVLLTEKGRAALAALDEPLIALHRAQFAHMDSEEVHVLTALLRKLRKADD
jgi:DNA-binding MarR family transcriptional regulator